jgi:hypothetical protein
MKSESSGQKSPRGSYAHDDEFQQREWEAIGGDRYRADEDMNPPDRPEDPEIPTERSETALVIQRTGHRGPAGEAVFVPVANSDRAGASASRETLVERRNS